MNSITVKQGSSCFASFAFPYKGFKISKKMAGSLRLKLKKPNKQIQVDDRVFYCTIDERNCGTAFATVFARVSRR